MKATTEKLMAAMSTQKIVVEKVTVMRNSVPFLVRVYFLLLYQFILLLILNLNQQHQLNYTPDMRKVGLKEVGELEK